MKVSFRWQYLKRCYEKSQQAVQKWGPDVGKKYVTRVGQLFDAPTLQVVREQRALNFHALKGKRQGEFALKLTDKWRLIVKEGDTPNSLVIWEVTNHYDD